MESSQGVRAGRGLKNVSIRIHPESTCVESEDCYSAPCPLGKDVEEQWVIHVGKDVAEREAGTTG